MIDNRPTQSGPAPPGATDERRERVNERLRQAFIEGAEEDTRRRLGRGLTAEELERVLRRYPGDVWSAERDPCSPASAAWAKGGLDTMGGSCRSGPVGARARFHDERAVKNT